MQILAWENVGVANLAGVISLTVNLFMWMTSLPLEEGEVIKSVNSFGFPVHNNRDISVLVGTGNIIWSGIYVMVSKIGIALPVGEEYDENDGQKFDIMEGNEARTHKESSQDYVSSSNTIRYGRRPDFKEKFLDQYRSIGDM
ncbi:unnamed protein product [Camellia sinensis]